MAHPRQRLWSVSSERSGWEVRGGTMEVKRMREDRGERRLHTLENVHDALSSVMSKREESVWLL